MSPRIFAHFILFVSFLWFCSNTLAQNYESFTNKTRVFSLDVKYLSFSDLKVSSSSQSQKIPNQIALGLNIRFYRIFSIVVLYNKSIGTPQLSSYGAGLRLDLPGFFFVNDSIEELVRKRKRHPLNSFLQYTKSQVSQPGIETYFTDRTTLGLDLFLEKNIYTTLDLSIVSNQGNQFLSPGIGLGYEF